VSAMAETTDVRAAGDRIGKLLDQLQATADRQACELAEELVRVVSELYGAGLARVLEVVGTEAPGVVNTLAADDLIASLLIVHGLHPDALFTRVSRALDSVRPFLAGHGGDVELLDIDEAAGAVHLRLMGSCDGCPSSAVTLQQAVERAILEAAPEIEIIDVEPPTDDGRASVSTPVTLGRKPTVAYDPATGCGAVVETGAGAP
jgi:Fe-S cluster biogenesis protein NfuA